MIGINQREKTEFLPLVRRGLHGKRERLLSREKDNRGGRTTLIIEGG